MLNESMHKIVLSKPRSRLQELRRIDIAKNGMLYQASLLGQKKVAHRNMDFAGAQAFVAERFGRDFLQLNAWDGEREYEHRASKKGKVFSREKSQAAAPKPREFSGSSFDRPKNRIINEGDHVPALVELGVFTKDFRLVGKRRDKFVQINRFLEIIDDEAKKLPADSKPVVVDFGCGKSYLTFLMQHYFAEILGLDARFVGIDADSDVIEKCAQAADRLGLRNIRFVHADAGRLDLAELDVGQGNCPKIAVSLHACNQATDHALAAAVKWGAELIFCAPCCQHEFSKQFAPKNLRIFADYGIIKERFCALATDLVRAKLLEHAGYSVQIIEFAGFSHTEKNLLVRAKKSGRQNPAALTEIEKLCDEFGFSPQALNLGGDVWPFQST